MPALRCCLRCWCDDVIVIMTSCRRRCIMSHRVHRQTYSLTTFTLVEITNNMTIITPLLFVSAVFCTNLGPWCELRWAPTVGSLQSCERMMLAGKLYFFMQSTVILYSAVWLLGVCSVVWWQGIWYWQWWDSFLSAGQKPFVNAGWEPINSRGCW